MKRKKFLKRQVLSFVLIILMMQPVVVMASTPNETNAIRDMLTSGFLAADAISDFEEFTQYQYDFKTSPRDVSEEWESDARAFINEFMSEAGIATYSADVDNSALAKATAISYAIECAKWSEQMGRTNNVSKEAEYMFLSHYVDRKDYFWNQGKTDYLFDGETMSGDTSSGTLAKWITENDRQSYDAYLSTTKAAASFKKIGDIASGIISIPGDVGVYKKIKAELDETKDWFTVISYTCARIKNDTGVLSVSDDIANLLIDALKKENESPERKVSELYKLYMEDEHFLAGYTVIEQRDILATTLSAVAAYRLSGITGVAISIGGTLKSNLCTFYMKSFMDLFSYTAWLGLQYSFSGRYALRASDYWES